MKEKHGKRYNDEIPKAFQEEGHKRKNNNGRKKKKKGVKIFRRILITLVIILVILIGVIYAFIQNKLSKMQQVDLDENDLGISDNSNLSGYRNIAIFGVDSRDNDLDKGNRSDCIMILTLNNKSKNMKLTSVYRDTYVEIDGHGLDKITHAYSYGGAQLAINTLNKNLDLNIREFVTVNFDSVAEAVEQLDGITINIESQAEVENVNYYINEVAKETGLPATKVTHTGKQTLNGVQAVSYSRCRYTSGGDYKRTERMRTVLTAIMDKLKTRGIGEINNFMDKMLPKVYTNIDTGDIMSLLPSAASFKITDSIGWPYETKGITLDRWYGVPITLESNVKQLHQEVFEDEGYIVPDNIKTISNKIVTKTGYTN